MVSNIPLGDSFPIESGNTMSNSTLRALGRPHCLNYGHIPVGGPPAICRVPCKMEGSLWSRYLHIINFIRFVFLRTRSCVSKSLIYFEASFILIRQKLLPLGLDWGARRKGIGN